ncbi:hypothetical protein E8E13_008009 [Curvularia kusanoi]|uniref:Uncharacterized protein n=1 Tax=Curvularia kusanoi TaxID=90978 RepID=A0A9P4TH87_CURKU|nr:hypothetical protein E8E13_008009 [Curvularia kusanoi]
MRPSPLTPLALLTSLALAQTRTNSTNSTVICPNQRNIDRTVHGHINSTGTVPITLPAGGDSSTPKPWYMSVLLNDTGNYVSGNDNGGVIAWPYLSVPSDVTADACVYSFGSYNKTAADDACGGVLETACEEFLLEAVRNSSRGSRCEPLSTAQEDIARRDEVCGRWRNTMGVAGWDNIGNKTCAIPSLPGVDIPDDYISRMVGLSAAPFVYPIGSKWDSYAEDAYNYTAAQAMAFAVVSSRQVEGGLMVQDVQLVCVTPNNTQPGSRVIEDKTPWPNSAVGLGAGAGSGLCAVVAGVAALLLTL